MKHESKILILSFIFGAAFWFWDAFVDSAIFKEGTYLDHLIFTVTLHEIYDRVVFFSLLAILGIFGAIAIRKQEQIQTELRQKETKISQALKEKEILLQEIHHRVKNNLQIIASLLRLQSNNLQDPQYQEIFKITENRIRAISLVHEKMYQAESIEKINFVEYLNSIIKALVSSMKSETQSIKIKLDLQPLSVGPNQAIYCGLILNEILSNAFKHAFPEGNPGEINVTLKVIDEDIINLVITDNGIGLGNNFNINQNRSLGFQIVKTLVQDQLRGIIHVESQGGTRICIEFRKGGGSLRGDANT